MLSLKRKRQTPRRVRQIARDISYSSAGQTKGGRTMIRVLENATGRMGLIRRVRGYALDVANGADVWQVLIERYGLSLEVVGGSLENIPTDRPVIVVSNHPYGILDGLMMGYLLSKRRGGDFKILANSVFEKSPDLERVILPISFENTKRAIQLNLDTRKEALRYLDTGGAIGVFPGGTVSTSATPFSQALDPQWRNFTAKMVAKSDAVVVPVFFEGANSLVFQLASHLHTTLRLGLLVREFRSRVGRPVRVVIGEPVPNAQLAQFQTDPKACMDFLRKATYELSPKPIDSQDFGREFEDRYKRKGKT